MDVILSASGRDVLISEPKYVSKISFALETDAPTCVGTRSERQGATEMRHSMHRSFSASENVCSIAGSEGLGFQHESWSHSSCSVS